MALCKLLVCTSPVGLAIENYELPLLDTILKQVRIQGSFLGTRAELREVFELARAGKVRMETATIALAALPGAMERMQAGRLTGRAGGAVSGRVDPQGPCKIGRATWCA